MFYERFLALCNARDVKPTSVADAIGLSRMNASFWKKGSMPSSANLQKLADYFEVPVGYLLKTPVERPATRKTLEDAELEAGRIRLKNLVDGIDAIPKENRPDAIREIAAFTRYTLDKYKVP